MPNLEKRVRKLEQSSGDDEAVEFLGGMLTKGRLQQLLKELHGNALPVVYKDSEGEAVKDGQRTSSIYSK